LTVTSLRWRLFQTHKLAASAACMINVLLEGVETERERERGEREERRREREFMRNEKDFLSWVGGSGPSPRHCIVTIDVGCVVYALPRLDALHIHTRTHTHTHARFETELPVLVHGEIRVQHGV